MEGTAGSVVFAGLLEFYATVYDLNNIEAIQQVIEKSLWKSGQGGVVGVARSRLLSQSSRLVCVSIRF